MPSKKFHGQVRVQGRGAPHVSFTKVACSTPCMKRAASCTPRVVISGSYKHKINYQTCSLQLTDSVYQYTKQGQIPKVEPKILSELQQEVYWLARFSVQAWTNPDTQFYLPKNRRRAGNSPGQLIKFHTFKINHFRMDSV